MPQLRITRDRRGYENTFLVHTFRRRGKTRSCILYWFRTPPDVKVGRNAFDEEAIRGIEATYPDVVFDWDRILTERPPPERDRRERFERPRRARTTAPFEPQAAASGDRPADAPAETWRPASAGPSAAVEEPDPRVEELVQVDAEAPAGLEPSDLAPVARVFRPGFEPQHDTRDGDTEADEAGDIEDAEEGQGPPEMVAASTGLLPVDAWINADRLRGLRIRYAELLARITQRISEPERQAALRIQAERLNPDVWVTEEEARAGLADYDRAYAALRATLGLRRRRRGGRGRSNKR